MFDVFCPRHASRVMLTTSDIWGFTNTDEGPALAWRCTCGEVGVLTRRHTLGSTGRVAAS